GRRVRRDVARLAPEGGDWSAVVRAPVRDVVRMVVLVRSASRIDDDREPAAVAVPYPLPLGALAPFGRRDYRATTMQAGSSAGYRCLRVQGRGAVPAASRSDLRRLLYCGTSFTMAFRSSSAHANRERARRARR